MKKALIIATVVKTHINAFHLPYIKWLSENGYEVHVAAKDDFSENEECIIEGCDVFHNLDFSRFPFTLRNISVYKELKKIISNNDFDLIHCHTPVGGALGRLASKKANANVIYTAHGYHFWKKGSKLNWIIYFPVEKFLSKYTDNLILINKEDYNLAVKYKMAPSIHYIPGVGIDVKKFNVSRSEVSSSYKLIYIGELSVRKNQLFLLDVIEKLKSTYPSIVLEFVGDGELRDTLELEIEQRGLNENVQLLGFRKDIPRLISNSDIVVSSSIREGLPVNIMESMAAGKALVVSNCRGNDDLVMNDVNGYSVNLDVSEFVDSIIKILSDNKLRESFEKKSFEMSLKYDLSAILPQYTEIYQVMSKKRID